MWLYIHDLHKQDISRLGSLDLKWAGKVMDFRKVNILHIIRIIVVSYKILVATSFNRVTGSVPIWPPVQSTCEKCYPALKISGAQKTHTFNLHSLSILDSAGKRNIWVPSIVQLILVLSWDIEGNWAYVPDLGEAHDERSNESLAIGGVANCRKWTCMIGLRSE